MRMRKLIPYAVLTCCVFVFLLPAISQAVTARDKYAVAESCYNQLRSSVKKMKYRDNWLRCIDKFTAVYKFDPSGPWAAVGLYKSGELYRELYKVSFRRSDKKEALDIFKRVVKRYPSSAYRPRAVRAIRSLSRRSDKRIVSKTSTLAKKKYLKAEACYEKFRNNPKKMKYRDQWLRCIRKFKTIYNTDPGGPWAVAGLYRSGELYREMYKRSYRKADKDESLDIFKQVIAEYPTSEYKPKSLVAIRIFPNRVARTIDLESESSQKKLEDKPADDIAAVISSSNQEEKRSAPKESDTADAGKTTVTGLRFWSNPNYTRVVIDADQETVYLHNLLKKDPSIHKPQRLYVDLEDCTLSKDTNKVIPINDNLLSDVRAGQYTLDSVRVVIDIKSFDRYNIFSLKNPFRIVIDVWGDTPKVAEKARVTAKRPKKNQKLTQSALAKQLALGVSRIVIDPGHGGKDYGAPGYLRGTHEKYVVLDISKKLARKIRSQLGIEVVLTRTTDRYLTLEERTAIANTENADLFISIHTNSARDRRAYGLETYFLNLATDDEAIRVAAFENATSTKNISDLQTILSDLMHNAKVNESSRLAVYVQESLHRHMKRKYSRIRSKGVKQAPFYVLLGAQMPSILVETSFISNPRECRRLKDPRYQDHLSEAIMKGIRKYIRETNPTAIGAPPRQTRSAG